MKQPECPECPECEKLAAVAPKSQSIGEFLEWFSEKQTYLCSRTEPCGECRTCFRNDGSEEDEECENLQFAIIGLSKEKMLAEFFDIDMAKVEKERQALLKFIRAKS